MNTTDMTERVTRAIKADATVFSEIGADKAHTPVAAAIVALIGLLCGAVAGINSHPTAVILGAALFLGFSVIFWLFGTVAFYGLAKLFGGSGDFQNLLRGNAYAAVPLTLFTIPVIGIAISLWSVYLFVVNVRENLSLSTAAAAAAVTLPVAITVLLANFFGSEIIAVLVGAF